MTMRANVGSEDGRTVRPSSNIAPLLPLSTAKNKTNSTPVAHSYVQRASRTTHTSLYQLSATSSLHPYKPHTRHSPSRSRPTSPAAPHSQRPSHPPPTQKRASRASSVSLCAGCAGRSAGAEVRAPARKLSCAASRMSSCGGCAARMSWLWCATRMRGRAGRTWTASFSSRVVRSRGWRMSGRSSVARSGSCGGSRTIRGRGMSCTVARGTTTSLVSVRFHKFLSLSQAAFSFFNLYRLRLMRYLSLR